MAESWEKAEQQLIQARRDREGYRNLVFERNGQVKHFQRLLELAEQKLAKEEKAVAKLEAHVDALKKKRIAEIERTLGITKECGDASTETTEGTANS